MRLHPLLLAALLLIPIAAPAAPRPNIILMMADDMGWSDIGCYGGEVQTPNLDRIAGEGILFTQFYNNGKCTTTRASLLTGLYPRKGGKGIELLSSDMLTLGEGMRLAGYQTGLSGKWHNGSKAPHRPFDRGFDKSYGLWDGCSNFFDPAMADPKFKGGRIRFFGEDDRRITEFDEDFYHTDAFVDHAIATIKAQAATGEPFLHYIPFTAPHYPLHAPEESIAKYRGLYEQGWETLREQRYARQVELGLIDPEVYPEPGMNENNATFATGANDDIRWENLRMEVYAAMIDRMDEQIGRVLDTLDELGIADNTLILFLSDNGGCAETPGGNDTSHVPGPKEFYSHCGPNWAWAQNTPFRRYKADMHEGGIATPFIARWPAQIKAGSRTDQVGHIIDLLPTFLDAAGTAYPASYHETKLIPVEGISLLPVFENPEQTLQRGEPLFWHWAGSRAVRDGKWKLVWDKRKKSWALYDLAKNRTETQDLSADMHEKVEAMTALWVAWAEKTGVKF